jgi:hypothetical protein
MAETAASEPGIRGRKIDDEPKSKPFSHCHTSRILAIPLGARVAQRLHIRPSIAAHLFIIVYEPEKEREIIASMGQ